MRERGASGRTRAPVMTERATPLPAAEADDTDATVQALARERFVDLFLGQNRRAQASVGVAAVLLGLGWARAAPAAAAWALGWMLLALAVIGWRYRASESFVRRAPSEQQAVRVAQLLALSGVALSGALAGFGAFSELERAGLSMILMATVTASVATTSGYRNVFLAYAVPMLVPLAVAWGWTGWVEHQPAAQAIGALVLLYLGFLLGVSRQAAQVLDEACRFRHGEQRLTRQLARALEDASQANQAKTRFLAAASHDLRQPLHSMNVLVATLGLRELDPATREVVTLLGKVNHTLSRQLDTLLDVSKLDAGVIRAELAVHPLGPLLRTLHEATQGVATQRGLRCVLDLTDEPLPALTDATLLNRALSNLVDNALKFTPTGGELRLSARRQGGLAVLQVADSGIGIDPSDQERVFHEFVQLGNVERDRLKGLGLGLSIVRRLCTLLDVPLELQSQPGRGTTVTLRVPLADGPAPTAPREGASAPSPRGLRVMVIDDDVMVRQGTRLLLSQLGCEVHQAEDLAGAVQLAARHRLDVLLCDLRLRGGETGLGVIQAVRALQPGLPAVLITGDTAPDRMREAQAAGVPLLFKPVRAEELLAVLPAPS